MSRVATPRDAVHRKPVRPAHGVARLTLHINSTAYQVKPLPSDPSAANRVFRLRKADGVFYHVAATQDGAVCDCPDFTFRRDGIDPDGCKHIRALTVVGLLSREGGAA